MFKVTYKETVYDPSEDTSPGFVYVETKTILLDGSELEEFSKTHDDFEVRTVIRYTYEEERSSET